MSISNYELGIVFPLRKLIVYVSYRSLQIARENTQKAADALAPFARPARPYSSTDVPWVRF